jgi:hypothetical protein
MSWWSSNRACTEMLKLPACTWEEGQLSDQEGRAKKSMFASLWLILEFQKRNINRATRMQNPISDLKEVRWHEQK